MLLYQLVPLIISVAAQVTTIYRYTGSDGTAVLLSGSQCQCPASAAGIVVSSSNSNGQSGPGQVGSGPGNTANAGQLVGSGSSSGTNPAGFLSSSIISETVDQSASRPGVVVSVRTSIVVSVVPVASIFISIRVVAGITETIYSTQFTTVTSTVTATLTTSPTSSANGGAVVAPGNTMSGNTMSSMLFPNTTLASTTASSSNPSSLTMSGSSTSSSSISSSSVSGGAMVNAAFCSSLFGLATVVADDTVTSTVLVTATQTDTATTSRTTTLTSTSSRTTDLGVTLTQTDTQSFTTTDTRSASTVTSVTASNTTSFRILTQTIATKVYYQTGRYCALDGAVCNFAGSSTVFYGLAFGGTTSLTSTYTSGPITCTAAAFGAGAVSGRTCFVAPPATFVPTTLIVGPTLVPGVLQLRKRQTIASSDLAAASAACSMLISRPVTTVTSTISATATSVVSSRITGSTETVVSSTTVVETDVATTGSVTTVTSTPGATTQLPDVTSISSVLNSIIQGIITTAGAIDSTTVIFIASQTPCAANQPFTLVIHDPAAPTPAAHIGKINPGAAVPTQTASYQPVIVTNDNNVYRLTNQNIFYNGLPLAYDSANTCSPFVFGDPNVVYGGQGLSPTCSYGDNNVLSCGPTANGAQEFSVDNTVNPAILRQGCTSAQFRGVSLQAVCALGG